MATDSITPGKETTEYAVAKWIVLGGGILIPILSTITGYIATQPEPSSVGMVVVGIITAAVTGVVGWASKIYNAGRTALKVAQISAGEKPAAPSQ